MTIPGGPRDPEKSKRLGLKFAMWTMERDKRPTPSVGTAVRYAASCGASTEEISGVTGLPAATVQQMIEPLIA